MKLATITGITILGFAFLALGAGALSASPAGTARASGYRIVLASTRDGATRAYSARPDVSHLTPLLRPTRALEPLDVSGNGRTVLYTDHRYPNTIYVSRADGTGLRRVARGNKKSGIDSATLSPDGKRLAFTSSSPQRISVVGADGRGRRSLGVGSEPDWSPDGKALVFANEAKHCSVLVQSLQGGRRVLARGGACSASPKWSPDGRWIAYERGSGTTSLWVVGLNGKHRHRVARSRDDSVLPYAWSPDSRRLVFTDYTGVFVVGLNSGPRPLRLGVTPASELSPPLAWSPDGRRLILSAHEGDEPDQLWAVGGDGHGLRRLTKAGANNPLGWTRLAPVLRPAGPLPLTERVLGPRTISTRKPISELSADRERVAFVSGSSLTDCEHVALWTPAKKSILRVSQRLRAPCSYRGSTGLVDYGVYELALAGSQVAWSEVLGCGNNCDVAFATATLPGGRPVGLVDDVGESGGGAGGGELEAFNPHGDGDLLVFNPADAIVQITKDCSRKCKVLRNGAHTYTIDSVSGHLIAVREPKAVAVVDDQGSLVNVLPFARDQVKAARLDGSRLVIARPGVLEVYDAVTGAAVLQRPLPTGYALTEVDGGIAVLQHAGTILLLRLADGRSLKLTPARGPVLADLEEPGLYYSYAAPKGQGRLVFLPRADLERQLGSPAQRTLESIRGRATGRTADWLLLTSNRDGKTRTYSVAPDGSRLTPLFPPGGGSNPVAVSRDGSTVVYSADDEKLAALSVSRADGTGLRQVAKTGQYPAFSPNGKLLAFVGKKGIWVVGTNGRGLRRLAAGDDPTFDWSPSGKALVLMRVIDEQKQRFALVVQPLRGKQRVLVRTGPNDDASAEEYEPDWSPDGRWIAYVNRENKQRRNGLTLIRPNGKNRHRIVLGQSEEDTFDWSADGRWIAYEDAPELDYILPNGNWHKLASRFAGSLAWSPDGKRLAYTVFAKSGGELVVAAGDGRGPKQLHLGTEAYLWQDPIWSPDSSRIAFGGSAGHDPIQLWVVGRDGSGLVRLTNDGVNFPVGWTGLAPVMPPAGPLPPTERVLGADSVATSTPVAALSANGGRVAIAAKPTVTDCEHVVVWTPGGGLSRLGNLPAPCGFGSQGAAVTGLALAGTRAAWVSGSSDESAENCWFSVMSATLADPAARLVGGTGLEPTQGEICKSADIDHLRGDGDLLVFNDQPTHSSALVRIGVGAQKCGELLCTTLRTDAQAAPAASVSAGLIATRTPGAVAVLDEHGTLVRLFSFAPADVNEAVLDGGQLLVWRFGVLEVYDVATGGLTLSRALPPGYRLVGVDGGIALLLRDETIMLLRLGDGHSFTLASGSVGTLVDLEASGLYYSFAIGNAGRVVFVPRSTLLQNLGGPS